MPQRYSYPASTVNANTQRNCRARLSQQIMNDIAGKKTTPNNVFETYGRFIYVKNYVNQGIIVYLIYDGTKWATSQSRW